MGGATMPDAGSPDTQNMAMPDAGTSDAPAGKTAVAMLMSTGQTGLTMISGKATFTQTGNQVKLVIELENCPQGARATHIHLNKDCGSGGNAAGNHWVPNGEGMGNIQCAADQKARFEMMRGTNVWTIGPPVGTDITTRSLMVHRNADPSPGDRIACGIINAQ
jgi:Cu/Zn superoxide dismutase